jgi:hypothetical protein
MLRTESIITMTKSLRYGALAAPMIFAAALHLHASQSGGIRHWPHQRWRLSVPRQTGRCVDPLRNPDADQNPRRRSAICGIHRLNAIVRAAAALPPGLIPAPAAELLVAANALLPSVEALSGVLRASGCSSGDVSAAGAVSVGCGEEVGGPHAAGDNSSDAGTSLFFQLRSSEFRL